MDQIDLLLSEFLASVDVGVLRPFEGSFQFFQLIGGERRPGATLLPLQRNSGLGIHIRIVIIGRRRRF